MKIEAVTERNVDLAGSVHAIAWQDSHRAFCAPDFIALHTPERQTGYLLEKMHRGASVYLLTEGEPIGIVSVTGSLIEDLYMLPQYQNRGYGTKLLRFAMQRCSGAPTLWILENNSGARRLYERYGFRATGNSHRLSDTLSEIEFIYSMGENA